MLKNTFYFLFLSVLFVFGIIMGISFAEQGINRVAGNVDEAAPKSFHVTQSNQKLEIKVLGKTVETELPPSNPKTDQQNVVKKSDQTPFLSKVGNKLGNVIQSGTEKGLQYISKIILN